MGPAPSEKRERREDQLPGIEDLSVIVLGGGEACGRVELAHGGGCPGHEPHGRIHLAGQGSEHLQQRLLFEGAFLGQRLHHNQGVEVLGQREEDE